MCYNIKPDKISHSQYVSWIKFECVEHKFHEMVYTTHVFVRWRLNQYFCIMLQAIKWLWMGARANRARMGPLNRNARVVERRLRRGKCSASFAWRNEGTLRGMFHILPWKNVNRSFKGRFAQRSILMSVQPRKSSEVNWVVKCIFS